MALPFRPKAGGLIDPQISLHEILFLSNGPLGSSPSYPVLTHRAIHFAFASGLTAYAGHSPLRACTT